MKKSSYFFLVFILLFGTNFTTVYAADYSGASSWAVETLNRAEEYGLITDRVKDNMSKYITREEFAELAVRLFEVYTGKTPSIAGMSFTDTQNPQILKAAGAGLVNGVGNGKFAPNDVITREQMAVILLRTLKVINISGDYDISEPLKFADDAQISSWAKEAVYYCANNSIVSGVGNNRFDPKGTATREQGVIVITRAYEMLSYTVDVYVNDSKISMGEIEIITDTPFANPIPILEKLGAEYQWDEKEKTLAIYYGNEGIAFQDGNQLANHNNTAVVLPFSPYIQEGEGKLFIPLVPLFEALDLNVDWNYQQAYLLLETKNYNPGQSQDTTTVSTDLVGLWSTNKTSGVRVDSYGYITEFTYSGSWYYFGEDGRFRSTIIFNGQGAFLSGQYRVDGDKIYVTDAREGYIPEKGNAREDVVYTFSFENYNGEIRLMITDWNGITDKCYKN